MPIFNSFIPEYEYMKTIYSLFLVNDQNFRVQMTILVRGE